VNYNCRGWVIHHNADIWRGTAVVDGFSWGIFTVGGAWLCQHLWEHYDFSRDKEFLARAYPTLKESAEFFVDFLIPDRHGHLVTSPSISFEQGFRTLEGKTGRLCAGPTLDRVILRDLFSHCIQASEILGCDEPFRAKLFEVRSRLVPAKISPRTGQIQEWSEDWDPDDTNTGQIAPLWAIYPGDQITPWGTPDLAVAAKKTLLGRGMAFGSWCSATRVNYAARLNDGKLFAEMLGRHMSGHVMPSLLSDFGGDLFQIDGNQGVTAGIAEALMQSHAGVIHLLPALPKGWPTGSVRGLRARGGFEVDIAWRNGRLATATIRSRGGQNPKLCYGSKTVQLKLDTGQAAALEADRLFR
jgi:alpha-L-fucosidase 2